MVQSTLAVPEWMRTSASSSGRGGLADAGLGAGSGPALHGTSVHPGSRVGDDDQVSSVFDTSQRLRRDLCDFLRVNGSSEAPPVVETLSSSVEDGYSRHLVHLTTGDDVIPACLAVPTGDGPFPAAVIFHQHAGQRHFGKSEVFGLIGDPYQAFAPPLARAGFVVLAPDSIAFEDRRTGRAGTDPRDDDWDQHYNALAHRLVTGDTLMRKVLDDAVTAVSTLLAMPGGRPEQHHRTGALLWREHHLVPHGG